MIGTLSKLGKSRTGERYLMPKLINPPKRVMNTIKARYLIHPASLIKPKIFLYSNAAVKLFSSAIWARHITNKVLNREV